MNKCWIFFCGILILGGLSCQKMTQETESRVTSLPYFNDPTFTPHWLTPQSDAAQNFHTIPKFTFVNQLGNTITQKTFENKIYITNFFFTTCPGICPKMTDVMLTLQELYKNNTEVLLLSHSVMPTYDTVPALKAYAIEKGILAKTWHLVTGDRAEIYDLGRNHYFIEENLGITKSDADFLHTENILLIDKYRHIRGIYNSLNRASMQQLRVDVEALRQE